MSIGSRLRLLIVLFFGIVSGIGWSAPAYAQEFDCDVSVDFSQLTGNNYEFLQDLQEQIFEYINNRAWTEHRFQDYERINCTFQVSIEDAPSLTSFKARLIVATRRPIYGTLQSSTVVQFSDSDWEFNYAKGTPLTYEPDQYNPLTSVIDFYVFLMLGYDFDTFSERGGTPYFEQARRITDRAISRGAQGWSQLGTEQTRQQLISQLLDTRYQRLRKAYFDYHYGGLDHFVQETETARTTVMGVLTELETLRDEVSRSYAQDLFFSSKYQELTAIFMDAQEKSQAYSILSKIDPAHMTEYNRLTQ